MFLTTTNPYRAAGFEENNASPSVRWLRAMAWGFGLYTLFGHVLFYGRVALSYAAQGPPSVERYLGSGLVLGFLSFFGAVCVVATYVYTFRRTAIRPTLLVMLAVTLCAVGLCLGTYFWWGQLWVRAVAAGCQLVVGFF